MYTSKASLVDAMRQQITSSPSQAAKALVRVYEYQTEDEKQARDVKSHNGVGFKPQDAKLLSGIAVWVLSGKALTPRQYEAVRKMIGKYAGQLVDQAISRGLIQKVDGKYLYGKDLVEAKG